MNRFKALLTSLDLEAPILRWLLLSLAFHLIAATFGLGFYHDDEHFQILELASFKLGTTPESARAWEYGAKMRPWLMPSVVVVIAKFWRIVGVDDPFFVALNFRLLSSLLGWASIVALVLCVSGWFKNPLRRWAILTLCFLWYTPFLHARTSSENWAGSFFVIGLALFVIRFRYKHFTLPWALFVGLLWGIAFECRYQVGVMIFFVWLWMAFVKRLSASQLLGIASGLIVALALGQACDLWGYGQWTLAPLNYLTQNLMLGKAAEFGVSPWWSYLSLAFIQALPPISLLVIFGFIGTWFLYPRHLLTWATLPFVLVHCLVGHKELRFLFPLISLTPLLIFMPWQKLWPKMGETFKSILSSPWLVRPILGLNFLALLISCLLPLKSQVLMQRLIHTHDIKTLYSYDAGPFDYIPHAIYFYRPPTFELKKLSSYDSFITTLQKSHKPLLLFSRRHQLPPQAGVLSQSCKLEYTILPQWILNDPYSQIIALAKIRVWAVFRCQIPN